MVYRYGIFCNYRGFLAGCGLVVMAFGCGKRSTSPSLADPASVGDSTAVVGSSTSADQDSVGQVVKDESSQVAGATVSPVCERILQGVNEHLVSAGLPDDVATFVNTFEVEGSFVDEILKESDDELVGCGVRSMVSGLSAAASAENPGIEAALGKQVGAVVAGTLGAVAKELKSSGGTSVEGLATRLMESAFASVVNAFPVDKRIVALGTAYVAATESLAQLCDSKEQAAELVPTLQAVALARLMTLPNLDLDSVIDEIARQKSLSH